MTRVVVCAAFAVAAGAQTPAPNDYSNPKTWLCRPGQHDACDVDLSTTVIAQGGKMTREEWKANPNAPIDCFYVYPTVSTDPTPNSDMTPDAAELNTIRLQFARFGSKCRAYAPVYRQITLAGLRLLLGGVEAGYRSITVFNTTMCGMPGAIISSTTTLDAASCSSAIRKDRSFSRN